MSYNKTLNYIRNKSFWALDFIKGGEIKGHYKDITSILDNPMSSESVRKQQEYLDHLLQHATSTTKFYNTYQDFKSLQDFPVIKKDIVQKNFEDFKSAPFLNKNNYKVATSGSTGVPFILYQDKNKRYRNNADAIYFLNKSNYTIGNQLYELEIWRAHNQKGFLKSWLQNVVQFDITKLTEKRILTLLNNLKESKQQKTLLGFASSYETICHYLDKSEIELRNMNISSIIANSEYLNEYSKKSMQNYFDAPILSRYSSEEIGIVAHQTLNSPDDFIINSASYHIEILDFEKNEPAKPGTLGRIVITDLFNYSMPLIRYDTGDIAKLKHDENGLLKFEHIEGRRMDLIYDTEGNIISSFVIYTKFRKYYMLLNQYQFIQQGEKEYQVILNIIDEFPFENELIADVRKDFGDDAIVEIIYVDEIPALASGKRKKVVNKFHKQTS